MKISPIKNIFFQKKLVANCAVKGSDGNVPCSIYRIEDSDRDYFIKLIYKEGWKDYYYATLIDSDIRKNNVDKIYVIEDSKSDCLGFMKVDTRFEDKSSLEFIEVKPEFKAKNTDRQLKYIGETMLNFLAQITQSSGKEFIIVPHPDSSAVGFYKKCHFTPTGKKREVIMSQEDAEKLDKQNYMHTGSKINFIW